MAGVQVRWRPGRAAPAAIRATWLQLLVAPVLLGSSPAALAAGEQPCPVAERRRSLPPPAASDGQAGAAPGEPGTAAVPPAADPAAADYRHRLRATPFGWPRRDHWCVWIEPGAVEGPAARWHQAWAGAVTAALASWRELLPLTVVEDRERAQVLVWRRRPPLRGGRASHGRAELELLLVQRGGQPALEPRVTVSISPGQRPQAIEATALHELGHAFGLWGHSDDPTDALAAVPGATPIRSLSARDRATLQWLQRQPGLQLTPALLESWGQPTPAAAPGG
jgi:hypothetical protein